jgi:dTDP-4-amino-4,6-dideoxygalactose transaminase
LKKLPTLSERRGENIRYLESRLSAFPFLTIAGVRPKATHAYYQHVMLFDEAVAGVHRDVFIAAVAAELMPTTLRETEGINLGCGYVRPLYLLPMFQKKMAYGSSGYPWSATPVEYDYSKGSCPVTEQLHYHTLVAHEYMRPGMTTADMDDFISAIQKVWDNIDEIKS